MVLKHLVNRGIDLAQRHAGNDNRIYELPGSVIFIVAATIISSLLLQVALQYTYGLLVPILVMTEVPTTTVIVKTTAYHDDVEEENPDAPLLSREEKESQLPRDEEVVTITHAPLTSRFRTIIKHLEAKTQSRMSRYRAVGGHFVYSLLAVIVTFIAKRVFWSASYLVEVPLLACLCLFGTAWVQQAVAMPGKNYFQRVAELRKSGAFKKLFVPVLLVEAVERAVFTMPRNIAIVTGTIKDIDNTSTLVITSLSIALAGITFLVCLLSVVLPLNIALVRLQVSLLPEETETVIPIDRSLGDAQVKDLRSAWKSFPRAAVWRLIKTWVKAGLIQITLALVTITAVVVQLRVLARPQFDQIIRNIHQELEM